MKGNIKWLQDRQQRVAREMELARKIVMQFLPKQKPAKDNPTLFTSPEQFKARLMKWGYEELGSGFFSTVLGKPGSDKVIKITRRISTDGWLPYIKWANRKGFGGTFAPKAYSYKFFPNPKYDAKKDEFSWRRPEPGFGVTVMERMKTTLGDTNILDKAKAVSGLVEYAMHGNETAVNLINQVYPGVTKFLGEFKKDWEDYSPDIHGGNMMVRDNGSLVISDPIGTYVRSNNYKMRLRAKDFAIAA